MCKRGILLDPCRFESLSRNTQKGSNKRIGTAAEKLVPLAAAGYIGLCILVLTLRSDRIGKAFDLIFRGGIPSQGRDRRDAGFRLFRHACGMCKRRFYQ